MQTGQVFVSHTSDMARVPAGRSFVQAALDGVSRAGLAVVDMRYFPAQAGTPAEYCRARVALCEVYLAVVGFRYGSLVPGSEVSYTEMEFEAASAAGLPRLVFLLEDGARRGRAGRDRERAEAFRQRLREAGLVVRTFRSSDRLELEVFHALSELAASGALGGAALRSLPRDVSSFTGRDRELGELLGATAAGVAGIHAIGGMAGVGKTAFAVHAAHRLADRFPDGQVFVSLHGHTPGQRPAEPAAALASLLQAAGVDARQIPEGSEARMSLWRDRIADKQLLLVLDDAASSEQVQPLLPGAAGCLVLVTSRRRLTALEDARTISLDSLAPGEAVALLMRLAARPDLDEGDPAVAEITRLCGYLPLAVGMLARQLHHHPAWAPADVAADLAAARDRLALMTAEDLSVAAAFDMSYQDLMAGQRRLFRRLGLHLGPDLDAYAAAALDGSDLAATRQSLEALYGLYLIAEPARGRYRFHDLIRAHARALAATDPQEDQDAAVGRLMDYYQHTAALADARLARQTRPGPAPALVTPPGAVPDVGDSSRALAWARTERATLTACLDHAMEAGQHARVVALTAALTDLLRRDGPWADAITRHGAAVAAARRLGDRLGQANALNDLGIARRLTGDYPSAAQAHGAALAIYRDIGDRLGEANALNARGAAQRATSDYPAAVQAHDAALAIYRDMGDRLGEANALSHLGVVRYLTDDYPGAAQANEAALSIYRDLGDRLGQAHALSNLGFVRRLTGDYPGATRADEAALGIFRDLGDRLGQAHALNDLGETRQAVGDYLGAGQAAQQALDLYQSLNNLLGQANALRNLAIVRRLSGDYSVATEAIEQALGLYRAIGDRGGEAMAINEAGTLHRAQGDLGEATLCHRRALDLAREIGSAWDEAHALAGLSRCALGAGRTADARASLRQALEIFQRIGAAETAAITAELAALTPARSP